MLDAELRSEDSPAADEQSMVEVTLEFGCAILDQTSQLLKAGDSLRLDQMADEPLDVLVAGRPIARGELVTVEGRLGIRIVELLLLMLAWLLLGGSAILADERPQLSGHLGQ